MKIKELETVISLELARCKGRASLFLEIEGQVIEFNSNEIYQSASLIKLPILYEALSQIETGKLLPDKEVAVGEQDKVGDTGVLQALQGKSYSIQDLLALMIMVSDNTAANLLIDQIGMEAINLSVSRLGMADTILQRKMLDFKAIQAGRDNFTSAADILICLKEGLHGKRMNQDSKNNFFSTLLQQQFRDKLTAYMNGVHISSGGKSGELPGIEHDCAVIKYGNRIALAVVLIDSLTEPEDGKSTIRQIGKHINRYISSSQQR